MFCSYEIEVSDWEYLFKLILFVYFLLTTRAQYRKEASAAYHQKMLAAHSCKDEYPKIRTFNQTEQSTNSLHYDMEAAKML